MTKSQQYMTIYFTFFICLFFCFLSISSFAHWPWLHLVHVLAKTTECASELIPKANCSPRQDVQLNMYWCPTWQTRLVVCKPKLHM